MATTRQHRYEGNLCKSSAPPTLGCRKQEAAASRRVSSLLSTARTTSVHRDLDPTRRGARGCRRQQQGRGGRRGGQSPRVARLVERALKGPMSDDAADVSAPLINQDEDSIVGLALPAGVV